MGENQCDDLERVGGASVVHRVVWVSVCVVCAVCVCAWRGVRECVCMA